MKIEKQVEVTICDDSECDGEVWTNHGCLSCGRVFCSPHDRQHSKNYPIFPENVFDMSIIQMGSLIGNRPTRRPILCVDCYNSPPNEEAKITAAFYDEITAVRARMDELEELLEAFRGR